MLDYIKNDLISQLLLVGIAIAALFACGIIGFVLFMVVNRPTTPAQQAGSEPPVEAVTIQPELDESTKQTYLILIYLDGSTVMLEETANQVQDGQMSDIEAMGALVAVSIVISQATGALSRPAPDPDLQAAWEKGQVAAPVIKEVTRRWFNKEITPGDVAAELAPARESIDQAMQLANDVIGQKYAIDPSELSRVREDVMNELRGSMSTEP